MILMLIGVSIGVACVILIRRVVNFLANENPNVVDDVVITDCVPVKKRGGGRPKGAKNKKKRVVKRRTPKIDVFDDDEEETV